MAECLGATNHRDFYFEARYGFADGDPLKINQFDSAFLSKNFGDPKRCPVSVIEV
jgi:hypothetical protein